MVRPDPVKPGLLFAGTESSIYASFDDGDSWQSLALNLPNTPVRDLMVKDNDLLIATHGRGLWVLDDISTLRQVTPTLAEAPVHLFTPGRATRTRRNVNSNTPLPPETPHAENPPNGVIVDYWLGAAATGRVTLEVLDARGRRVRTFSSDPITPVAEAARPPHPNFWVEVLRPLPTSAGFHRVTWNLRHDAPLALSHSFEINANPGQSPAVPDGPLVLPGVYTLRLSANGVTRSAQVTVRNDPRSGVSVAALTAQQTLLLQIVEQMRITYTGQRQVDALRAALTASEAGASPEVRAATATLRTAIDTAVGADASAGSVGKYRDANDALGAQLTAQDNADNPPNAGMLAALASVSRDAAAIDTAWARVLQRDLPALNARRAQFNLAPVSVRGR